MAISGTGCSCKVALAIVGECDRLPRRVEVKEPAHGLGVVGESHRIAVAVSERERLSVRAEDRRRIVDPREEESSVTLLPQDVRGVGSLIDRQVGAVDAEEVVSVLATGIPLGHPDAGVEAQRKIRAAEGEGLAIDREAQLGGEHAPAGAQRAGEVQERAVGTDQGQKAAAGKRAAQVNLAEVSVAVPAAAGQRLGDGRHRARTARLQARGGTGRGLIGPLEGSLGRPVGQGLRQSGASRRIGCEILVRREIGDAALESDQAAVRSHDRLSRRRGIGREGRNGEIGQEREVNRDIVVLDPFDDGDDLPELLNLLENRPLCGERLVVLREVVRKRRCHRIAHHLVSNLAFVKKLHADSVENHRLAVSRWNEADLFGLEPHPCARRHAGATGREPPLEHIFVARNARGYGLAGYVVLTQSEDLQGAVGLEHDVSERRVARRSHETDRHLIIHDRRLDAHPRILVCVLRLHRHRHIVHVERWKGDVVLAQENDLAGRRVESSASDVLDGEKEVGGFIEVNAAEVAESIVRKHSKVIVRFEVAQAAVMRRVRRREQVFPKTFWIFPSFFAKVPNFLTKVNNFVSFLH